MQRNRLLMLAGAAAVAVVVVVVAILVGSGGGSGSPTTTTVASSGGSSGPEAATIFQGVPQHNDLLGKPSAPAVLTIYEDPQCPFCRQWDIDTLPTVVSEFVRTGKLELRYHGIAIISLNSVAGLRAIYGAGLQNKLWNMTVALYERQGEEGSGWITLPVIRDAAREVGANPATVITDADSKEVTNELNAVETERAKLKIKSTPTFILQKALGVPQQVSLRGPQDLEPAGFTQLLNSALQ